MVTSITRQSVIIKCTQQTSVLLGNYELYYIGGLLKKLFNFDLTKESNPQTLYDNIQTQLGSATPKDEREQYLLTLVSVYKPMEEYNEQMRELFDMGEQEEHLWQVHI